jgi:hypothetical protein
MSFERRAWLDGACRRGWVPAKIRGMEPNPYQSPRCDPNVDGPEPTGEGELDPLAIGVIAFGYGMAFIAVMSIMASFF